jgi:predicted Zn-dependent peptidase
MLIDEILWPNQALGRDIAGNRETITAMKRGQILDFFSNAYLPNNTVISIAGDIQQKKIQDTVSKALGAWKRNKAPLSTPNTGNQDAARLKIEFRETEQIQLCLAVPGFSYFHPDRFAVDLLSTILGEGMSSRLFTEIREQQGLAYDIHSYADHFADSGAVIINAGVDSSRVDNAVKAIVEQLSKIKEQISEAELRKAKEIAKGRLLLSLESSRNVAGWLGAQDLLTKRILTPDEVIALVEAVTIEDLKRVARELFAGQKLNLAVVGPVKKEQPLARSLKM